MKIKTIGHLTFKVTDMEAALKYYCDGLGFKEKFRLNDEAGRPWIIYLEITDHQFLELFYDHDSLKPMKQDDFHIGYLHLCIEVEDIYKAKEYFVEKGLPMTSDISLGVDNSYQFWTADPDGNRIELMQYTKDSLQVK